MGVEWCFSLLFCLLVGVCVVKSVPDPNDSFAPDLCHTPGCRCTDYAKSWKIINCTFNNTQKIQFTPGSIPTSTMEISIIGGEEIVMKPLTFNSLSGFHLFRIDGTKRLLTSKSAFINLTSSHLLLQIQGCDRLIVEANAFKNLQTPVSFELSRCSYVSIQNSAFSKLQDGKFQSIPYLELAEGAFKFENQAAIGRHGPVATISFQNVIMPKIPKLTFLSAVAEITIQDCQIEDIHPEAFSANQISALKIINTSLHRVQTQAFSDRTLIIDFKMYKCKINVIETGAVMAAISNFTVEHSRITEIHRGAVNSSVVTKAIITDNEIGTLQTEAFTFSSWNRINLDNNILKYVHGNFLEVSYNPEIYEFTFIGNEIYHIDRGALSFLNHLVPNLYTLKFDNNFFNETCRCDIDKWVLELLNVESDDVSYILNTSFCTVNAFLSRCFELPEGLINMQNFTELVCGTEEELKCEPYSGETITLNTTTITPLEEAKENNSNLILGLLVGAILILAVSGTIVILLIRGSLWLKRKGYCMRFRNMRYHQQDPPSLEEEGTIVETEISDKMEIPEELTPEILQNLRERLEDPSTHDEARQMIERLYDLFIAHDENYTNNNTHEEEAHLYEELGNLQSSSNHHQGNTDKIQNYNVDNDETFGFLKLMEERYNLISHDDQHKKPALAGEYSEPTDAAVHLYSELNQNKESEEAKKDSFTPSHSSTHKSDGSSRMACRPLPEKPKRISDSDAGPSKL